MVQARENSEEKEPEKGSPADREDAERPTPVAPSTEAIIIRSSD